MSVMNLILEMNFIPVKLRSVPINYRDDSQNSNDFHKEIEIQRC